MSTVTAGPSRPSTYDTRPDITLPAVPVSWYPSAARRLPGRVMPGQRPGIDPGPGAAQRPGSIPASSSASQRHLQQQPLLRVHRQRLPRADPEEPRVEPGRIGHEPAPPGIPGPADPRASPSRSQPRSAGNSEIASVPEATSSHSPPGLSAPPGSRHPIPTIATGSPAAAAATAAGAAPAGPRPAARPAGARPAAPGSGSRTPPWPAAAARWRCRAGCGARRR